MTDKIYLSKAAHDKMIQEFERLTGPQRKEIAAQLATARSFGDLGENAEYEAAKHTQLLNEIRIKELQEKLGRVFIINEGDIPSDKVYLGARVKVMDLDFTEEEVFHVVSSVEADPAKGKISVDSPVAKGMLGHGAGDEVTIEVPRGKLRFKILEISRA
jgi:transcription elongation factor GreA